MLKQLSCNYHWKKTSWGWFWREVTAVFLFLSLILGCPRSSLLLVGDP